MKDMISCIDFNKDSLGRDPNQFPDEEDIHKKIDAYVENFNKKKKQQSKRHKSKVSTVSAPRNETSQLDICITPDPRVEEVKLEKYVSKEHLAQQSQEAVRISKHSRNFPKTTGHQMHSTEAKRENGLESEIPADKDSGESSQKVLKLDFQRLHSGYKNEGPERVTMKNINKSGSQTKGYWSSSNEVE